MKAVQNQPYLMTASDEDRYVATSLGRLGEALLATNPRTYLQLLSYTSIGYYLIQNGSFILVSPGLATMLGYTMEELLDMHPLDLVIPADQAMVRGLTDKVTWEDKLPCRVSCGLITKGRKHITAQLENMPIKMAAQHAFHGLVINTNDLLHQDGRMGETVDSFRTIMDSVNDGLVVCDYASGRIIDLNSKIIEIFGYQRQALLKHSLYDMWIPDGEFDQPTLMHVIEQVKTLGPQIINWPMRRQDNTPIWINANLRYTVIRGQEVILITLRDVTEMLSVTNQLRRSEERFKLAASLASDLIYEENTSKGELFWHGDIDSLLGYAPGEFPRITKAWKRAIVPEMLPKIQLEIDRYTRNGEPFRLEYQVQKQDGNRLWIRERGKNLVDDTGNIVRCIGTITDITSLKQANDSLQQSEERFRLLAENARDIIFSVQIKPVLKFEYLSPALTPITGYLPEVFYNDPQQVMQVLEPEHRGLLKRILQNEVEFNRNWRASWRRQDGKTVWTEQNASVTKHQGKVVIQGVARDITQKKQLEDEMHYISTHDTLTGLSNRGSFEAELDRVGNDASPWSLIVFDLDGLKLINDTLGHLEGDQLLQAAAKIITDSTKMGNLSARIGGDEFALLIPGDDLRIVHSVEETIKWAVHDYNSQHNSYLSISMGYAISGVDGITNIDLFKEADNNMYRQKLLNIQSTRSSIIRGLTHTLKARDFQTEGHGDRMQNLVLQLAQAVGFAENRLNELTLLAQFHDIGKVGIPDHILFKPGGLDEAEFETMKRHSEIGFRIAQSVADLAIISDWILKHHEWWNGAGYPLGLKGEDIPMECRMLAIVDAYDAMTNNRPYRQALSKEEAISELRLGAGRQFDPQLVPLFIELIGQEN
ncbi:MAG: PAS domain S-box protein [Methylocystaceae bacterium]